MRKAIHTVFTPAILLPLAVLTACSSKLTIDLPSPVTTVGQATQIAVHVHDPRGVRSISASIEQNGASFPVWSLPSPSKAADSTFTFTAGVKTTPQLKDGKATLVLDAVSAGFGHSSSHLQATVQIVTQPPTVTADSDQHYLYLGMADLVTMNVTGAATESGVKVGDQTFRSWPMPGGKPGLFSLFAFAWNMPPSTVPVVYARQRRQHRNRLHRRRFPQERTAEIHHA